MPEDIITLLLGIQGFRVLRFEPVDFKGSRAVIVHLERVEKSYRCGECAQSVAQGYDSSWQEVRHLTFWQYSTILRFRRYRVNCPRCGIRTEALGFLEVRGPRVTTALSRLIYELCKVTTVKAVAMFFGLHRQTVKSIDKQALAKVQAERPLDGITVLGVDEISVGQGHHYWSLFSALEGPRGPEMLTVVEGRSEKKLKRFWRWFGKDRAARDHPCRHRYVLRLKRKDFFSHCPKDLRIIYDKFHILRHLKGALNEVRKHALRNALGRFRKTLSGKKFVLLSAPRPRP